MQIPKITDYSDGTFRPNATLTRAEVAVISFSWLKWRKKGVAYGCESRHKLYVSSRISGMGRTPRY
ncbi:S-layer homology domain-containing protein [Anabaena azotica]|uniref:S-layer homology domain-containing protein n=1 Tax=Anabaena azotica FACHB-119 TaxID=947527 RepID=A0ABR8D8F1_9NOST|nr:S-layer homology domain-containing protein [Anabaena azotica FACHB-119]